MYISQMKLKAYQIERDEENLKFENYDLKERLAVLYSVDWTLYDSIPHVVNIPKNTLILRVTEEICMNCYFTTLQDVIKTLSTKYTDSFHVLMLGKYRFNASFMNDYKDISLEKIKTKNLDISLPLDDLAVPYFLFYNHDKKLSKYYLFDKRDSIGNYKQFINAIK